MRLLHTVAVVICGIMLGKVLQFVAVTGLEDRIGFDAASATGLLPFIILVVAAKRRWPAFLSFRETWR